MASVSTHRLRLFLSRAMKGAMRFALLRLRSLSPASRTLPAARARYHQIGDSGLAAIPAGELHALLCGSGERLEFHPSPVSPYLIRLAMKDAGFCSGGDEESTGGST